MSQKKSRNTEKQNLVKEILAKSDKTLSAEDILDRMPIDINKTTVYRILERFAENGDVHYVTGKNGKAYYALCDSCGVSHKVHNHIHFQCQECHEVTCQPNTLKLPDLKGFSVKETQFLVIGICNKCQE